MKIVPMLIVRYLSIAPPGSEESHYIEKMHTVLKMSLAKKFSDSNVDKSDLSKSIDRIFKICNIRTDSPILFWLNNIINVDYIDNSLIINQEDDKFEEIYEDIIKSVDFSSLPDCRICVIIAYVFHKHIPLAIVKDL